MPTEYEETYYMSSTKHYVWFRGRNKIFQKEKRNVGRKRIRVQFNIYHHAQTYYIKAHNVTILEILFTTRPYNAIMLVKQRDELSHYHLVRQLEEFYRVLEVQYAIIWCNFWGRQEEYQIRYRQIIEDMRSTRLCDDQLGMPSPWYPHASWEIVTHMLLNKCMTNECQSLVITKLRNVLALFCCGNLLFCGLRSIIASTNSYMLNTSMHMADNSAE